MDYDKGKDEDGSKKQAAELSVPPLPNPPLQENLYEKRLAKLLSDLKAAEEKGYRKQLAEHCSAQRVIPINDGEEGVQQSDEPVIVFDMREVLKRVLQEEQNQSDDEVGDSQGDNKYVCVHCGADSFIPGKLGGVLALALSVVTWIIIHRFGMP